jgi:hypothetical protein
MTIHVYIVFYNETLLFIHIHVPHLLHLHGPKSEQQHDGNSKKFIHVLSLFFTETLNITHLHVVSRKKY